MNSCDINASGGVFLPVATGTPVAGAVMGQFEAALPVAVLVGDCFGV